MNKFFSVFQTRQEVDGEKSLISKKDTELSRKTKDVSKPIESKDSGNMNNFAYHLKQEIDHENGGPSLFLLSMKTQRTFYLLGGWV